MGWDMLLLRKRVQLSASHGVGPEVLPRVAHGRLTRLVVSQRRTAWSATRRGCLSNSVQLETYEEVLGKEPETRDALRCGDGHLRRVITKATAIVCSARRPGTTASIINLARCKASSEVKWVESRAPPTQGIGPLRSIDRRALKQQIPPAARERRQARRAPHAQRRYNGSPPPSTPWFTSSPGVG